MEHEKIGSAPYDGCLCTLVEGIKPFVVCFGVKVLMTCFPARLSGMSLPMSFYMGVEGRLRVDIS